jgi:hypothetical protein
LKNSSMSVVKVWVRTRSASVAPAAARAAFADLADLRAHVSFADDLAGLVAGEQAGHEDQLSRDDGHDRRIEHVPADNALRQCFGKQVLALDHLIVPSA